MTLSTTKKCVLPRLCCVMLGVLGMLIVPSVFAEEVNVVNTLPLTELLGLFLSPETALKWGSLLVTFCYLLTQVLPWIPPQYLAKLPPFVSEIIQRIAGNYKGTKNELTQRDTDIS